MIESMGFGGSIQESLHQLRMADLRARLGITEEKSGVDESIFRIGVKPRVLQTKTQACSNVWPEVTITGSAMRESEMGQRNSFGGSFGLGFNKGFDFGDGKDESLLKKKKIFHLRLGVIVVVAVSLIFCFSVSFSNTHLVCMGL